jgi:transcriptional regulator with XRE-family HTH domain
MYCNNLQQPRLDVLERIAILLDVDVRELIKPSEAK